MTWLKQSEMKNSRPGPVRPNAYNLINRTQRHRGREVCMREDVGLLPYSPLAQRVPDRQVSRGAPPAGARTTLFNRGQRYEKPGAETAIRGLCEPCAGVWPRPGPDGARLPSTAGLSSQSNIIGATSMAQLKDQHRIDRCRDHAGARSRIDAIHQVHMNPAP